MGESRAAAVIPAYNEEARIGAVIEALLGASLIDEIVVVDDGSTDSTADVARRYDVRVISREENGGKGAAVETAKNEVDADIIVFIDADLIGLKAEHADALVAPLLEDSGLTMTVGKFVGGRLRTDLAQKIVPTISGQRAVRQELLASMPNASKTRFGIEMMFTTHAKANGYKTLEIPIEGVTQVMKEEKLGYLKGLKDRIGMYRDIFKESASSRRRSKY